MWQREIRQQRQDCGRTGSGLGKDWGRTGAGLGKDLGSTGAEVGIGQQGQDQNQERNGKRTRKSE